MTDEPTTTVSVEEGVRNELWSMKQSPEDTYNDVIKRLLENSGDSE